MSDALKDIRDALSSRTQHFVLPKQWAAMRKAEQIERDTGTKILHFEKGDFQGDEFYPAPHIYEACAKAFTTATCATCRARVFPSCVTPSPRR